ncbi:MAG: TerB family tellurite resistance protein [Ignavibacteriales bacterium]|jgi:tellurite resistance protein|nr:TerB family tellurite resistance protein [Ignavibacteriales bacterium]MBK7265376.1 TerB family tellurite resistance protein [Ignavibacteriales bacterium]MBK8663140.1 TerB family tellurite resistance protein [Ignavibacteriales bacterium]MBP9123502.1 TerB family tellurite resistance protein [Ignavibacteriaceae bacterium]MCC6637234.1 TerB family tellurite resistance protein [Ignavibacteriaceae bacterium]
MLTTIDKSNYLKGLLIVARLDDRLIDRERDQIRNVATRLGFSKDFYEETLKNLMINENISDNPLMFSSPAIAEIFLNEALNLAYADNELSKVELDWLRKTAEINGIPNQKFTEFLASFQSFLQTDISRQKTISIQ